MTHLVSILQNLMCLKIVEYRNLVYVLDKSILKDFIFEAKISFDFLYGTIIGCDQKEVDSKHVLLFLKLNTI